MRNTTSTSNACLASPCSLAVPNVCIGVDTIWCYIGFNLLILLHSCWHIFNLSAKQTTEMRRAWGFSVVFIAQHFNIQRRKHKDVQTSAANLSETGTPQIEQRTLSIKLWDTSDMKNTSNNYFSIAKFDRDDSQFYHIQLSMMICRRFTADSSFSRWV